jgi:pimeloyl-ACP methyl ester carboxylesterase
VLVLAGSLSPPFFKEAADWLAARLGGTAEQVPGGHGAPFDHPADLAAQVVRFIEQANA